MHEAERLEKLQAVRVVLV